MEVRAHVAPVLLVPVNGEHLERRDAARPRIHKVGTRDARLLGKLARGHPGKVKLAVGMSSHPAPGVVDVVVAQKRVLPRRVNGPRARREVRKRTTTRHVWVALEPVEDELAVNPLLLVCGNVRTDIVDERHVGLQPLV